jgi:hypothetical protein
MVTVATKFGIGHVVVAGIIGGILFAAFEMLAAATLMGSQASFMPIRMIGAMLLGAGALDPGYSLAVGCITGLVIHIVLSIAFAMIFASIASPAATESTLALGGILFGTILWLVNFYVIAPLAGWTWFPEQTNTPVQFIAHAFFFGCPVGWYLGRSRMLIAHRSPLP